MYLHNYKHLQDAPYNNAPSKAGGQLMSEPAVVLAAHGLQFEI
jgi:hypothetical protein